MAKLHFFKKGTCILTEKPFIYALQSKYRSERCDRCFKSGKVLTCSNCQYVRYCDKFCQKEAWTDHRDECGKFKKLYPKYIPDAAVMMSRIVRSLQSGGDYKKGYYTSKYYRRFKNLMSHEENITKDVKRMEHFQSLIVVLRALIDAPAMPSNLELLEIYGKMCINCFNILDDDMNTIGSGMYLGASILDHNCQPNALATFDGVTIKIRLLEDLTVKELDFTKIFISYIDLMSPPDIRRNQLLQNYYFECVCEKCKDFNEQQIMNSAACPSNGCDEPLFLENNYTSCPKCKTNIKNKVVEKFNDVTTFTKTKLAEMKDITFLDVCKLCLKKQENVLHYYNAWHLKTLDHAFESAIDMNKWEEAIEYGLRLLSGFRKYNGKLNPLLGLLHLKIGKIQLYLEQPASALNSINSAEKILKITHGDQHDLYKKQLIPLLCQAADEYNSIQK